MMLTVYGRQRGLIARVVSWPQTRRPRLPGAAFRVSDFEYKDYRNDRLLPGVTGAVPKQRPGQKGKQVQSI